MEFKYKLAAAFAILGLLALIVFAIQWAYLRQPANTVGGNYRLDESFSASEFYYGPQAWVPYASKLPIMPGVDPNGDGGFYVMLVDSDATSDLNATYPCIRIDYSFTGLHGIAGFHVYGYIRGNGGVQWTNRPDGDGANGYYVNNSAYSVSTSDLTHANPMPSYDHIYLKVSNKKGAAFNDYGNNTYYMKFDKDGGGLNSLHITTDPRNPNGNVTTTNNATGTFYVDYTGGRTQDDFLLLVAVNGTIGNDFSLNLKSSVPG